MIQLPPDYLPDLATAQICVVGLGYVGLPLAVEFARVSECRKTGKSLNRKIIGFDLNKSRINQLISGVDNTLEISSDDLQSAVPALSFTSSLKEVTNSDVFIVTVPTPIDDAKRPDLNPLSSACEMLGQVFKDRNSQSSPPVVIFESTVYPGATEEVCVPVLEKHSGLVLNQDLFVGYSPERINPGDPNHKLSTVVKVTSGSCFDVSVWVDTLYASIISAGTHLAPSIRVAEAAKVIENTQRDLNIALVNELSIIFDRLGIDTHDVLAAAGSKWNFLPFTPGLVGGHCIGVDPYYLTHKAEISGYHPEVVLAGRRINDYMSNWFAEKLILNMAKANINISSAKILILGFTFKENCPDIRNTKVYDLITRLRQFNCNVTVVDSWASTAEVKASYGLNLYNQIPDNSVFDSVILAVAHDDYRKMSVSDWANIKCNNGIIFDIKGVVPRILNPIRL